MHTETLGNLQARIEALESRKVLEDTPDDTQDFDDADKFGSECYIDEILGRPKADPASNFLRDQVEQLRIDMIELSTRIEHVENGQVTKNPDLPYLHDQLDRAKEQMVSLQSRCLYGERDCHHAGDGPRGKAT